MTFQESLPESYTVTNGCWNCQNAFIYTEYDEGETYYCTLSKEPRPLCGTVACNEAFGRSLEEKGLKMGDEEYENGMTELIDTWNEWEERHRAHPAGCCDNWSLKKNKRGNCD